ncbi:hypothetical protein [Wohlfahrtiimonas chitiniclastica]|uniref:hypothetical protein n=1 Tax=Wohlfahrtiimonas chitiniclastica TaxID=400946 RepID=UPI0007B69752|nr:hypothetical protein [Wohlfahrtiimonas chitiniclastica]KZX37248.1 hypothetical protein A6V30_10205 [Wohlfahrtiimonas chitiniclastica]KZX37268.1 hypothetical protein A6V30_10310 [Wohlfahrtiimonas chitiniclastica]
MRNEDELMIALDIIKTYSEAAKINGDQLNDAIKKIEGVRSDLVQAAKNQAQETVKSEISEPIKNLQKSADQYWKESSYLVNELKEQSEKNRWRNSFILGIGSSILLGSMLLGIFLWLPGLDEIKERRAAYDTLIKYGLDISTCNGKTCVKVESNKCPYGKDGNYCIAIIK